MFNVYDTGKPASSHGYPQLKGVGWSNHRFETFTEAKEYALNWLSAWGEFADLKLNEPWFYYGNGYIVIREEP